MHDSIADMLMRIKNAGNAGLQSATIPFSRYRLSIAKFLEKKSFIKEVSKKGEGVKEMIEVKIAYNKNKTPKIKGLARVSKSSCRVYCGVKNIKPVRNGFGLLVLSTPKGILSGEEAKRAHVGGEPLFKIW